MADKTKEELIEEIRFLQKRIAELEKLDSERKQQQQQQSELQKEKQFSENIINTIQAIVLILDTKGRIVMFNSYMEQVSGYRLEEVKGKDWFEIFLPKEDHAKIRELFSKAISGIQTKRNINSVITKDGRKIEIEWYDKTIKGVESNTEGLLSIGIDVTELNKTKAALEEDELKIRAIFDQTFQFIGLMTVDGILIEANRTALEFSGIEASSVLNKPFWQTPWWTHSSELQEKLRQSIEKVAQGKFIRFEATHIAKDGTLHYIDFSLKPVKDENGKIIFMIPEGRDITEFKDTEEKNRKYLHELEIFYKASINREERIIELKKEIEMLKKELGK